MTSYKPESQVYIDNPSMTEMFLGADAEHHAVGETPMEHGEDGYPYLVVNYPRSSWKGGLVHPGFLKMGFLWGQLVHVNN